MLTSYTWSDIADLLIELADVVERHEWREIDPEELVKEFADELRLRAYEYDQGVFYRHKER